MKLTMKFTDLKLWQCCVDSTKDRPRGLRVYFSPLFNIAARFLLSYEILRELV